MNMPKHGAHEQLTELVANLGMGHVPERFQADLLRFGMACMQAQRNADIRHLEQRPQTFRDAADALRMFGPLAERPKPSVRRMSACGTRLVDVQSAEGS